MDTLLVELLGLGVSKYAIARRCGVHWNTVYSWVQGFYRPSEKYRWAMTALLMEREAEKAKKNTGQNKYIWYADIKGNLPEHCRQ